MVSVGEVRAMIPLYKRLKEKYPFVEFFLSTITQTGLAEAARCLPGAKSYFILPFDFSWSMRRLTKQIKPFLLILSEGDFWFNMLQYAKKEGARIVLVSGKLSMRSANRYAKIPFFAKRLFGHFQLICAQNQQYAKRFSLFSSSVQITGNLKYDIPTQTLSLEERQKWQELLGLKQKIVLVIGSTHSGEEELFFPLLEKFPNLKILIAPRHPERFDRVFALLPENKGRLQAGLTGTESIVLIDAMGLLSTCYQVANLAVVGGSFVPGVGGHNILEPLQAHVPVLFGPHMESQTEFVKQVLDSGAGMQLPIGELLPSISALLQNPSQYDFYRENAIRFTQNCRGTIDRTWNVLFP